MTTKEFETGAVCLGSPTLVASWWRAAASTGTGYRRQPQINIFEAAAVSENVYVPAINLTISGRETLQALRSVIDEALRNEPSEESK